MTEKYPIKLNEAISFFHAGKVKQALNIFQTLHKKPIDTTSGINLSLWIATCYIALEKISIAKKIINNALNKVEISESDQNRAQRLFADIHLAKFEFEPAMQIYLDLVNKETDLYELSYLQNLIEDADEKSYFYELYGTTNEWKNKLRAKIKKILNRIKPQV